jgi:3-oxoacyl-[acyl-carrier-protein] synthase-1
MRRIVVTGFGCITAVGSDAGATWESVVAGRSGIKPATSWEATNWKYRLAAEIKDYQPRTLVSDRKLLKVISRQDVLGLNAVDQALQHSGVLDYRQSLEDPTSFNDRTGVFVGSPGTKYRQQHDYLTSLAEAGGEDMSVFGSEAMDRVHPMWLLRTLPNNVLAYTGIGNGFKGANENVTAHGISGAQAIAEACRYLRAGLLDRAVVVGYDSVSEPEALVYYASMGLLSPRALKPFDRDRDGTILGEGAGSMVLEARDEADGRGATVHGEVLGSSVSSEGGILSVSEDGEGVIQAIQASLEDAGLRPDDIGMITAHANGSRPSDASEALAIGKVFGPSSVPVTGFKWSLGHTVAASGVIEGILMLLSLRERRVPGIASLENLAPDCSDLNVSAAEQSPRSSHGLLTTRGFAGLNSCVILSADVV